jgi:hypothetical protein
MLKVRMKCATSFWYARRVRALLRLANHTCSSGIAASWSTLRRSIDLRLDGTRAFVVLFVLFLYAIFVGVLAYDNPVYHALILPRFRRVSTPVIHMVMSKDIDRLFDSYEIL